MRADAVELAQVGATRQAMKRGADVECRLVPFRLSGRACRWQLSCWCGLLVGQRLEQLLDSAVTLSDLLAVELIGREVLLEREQVFGAIAAGQRRDYFLGRGLAAMIAVGGE